MASGWFVFVGAVVIIAGFAGLDRIVYDASTKLNHPGIVDPTDFYHRTIVFWDLCRLPGSWIGGIAAYVALAAFHRRSFRAANAGLIAFLAAGALTMTAQGVVGRIRPNHAASHLTFVGPLEGFQAHEAVCFPSGESTAAFALAGVLTYFFPRVRAAATIVAAFTMVARVVPGSHYLSDAAAGALVGAGVSEAVLRAFAQRWMTAPPFGRVGSNSDGTLSSA